MDDDKPRNREYYSVCVCMCVFNSKISQGGVTIYLLSAVCLDCANVRVISELLCGGIGS